MGKLKNAFNSKTLRIGGYSIIAGVVVIAIAVAVNMLVAEIPLKYTQFDLTQNEIFTVSEQTREILSSMDKDVMVYWITPQGYEDVYVQKMLDVYRDLTDRLDVVKIDPILYPSFTSSYTTEKLYDNSLIFECGDRSMVVNSTEIFVYDLSNYYTTGEYSESFDGESRMTAAINYVISDDMPIVYTLTGHGESDLSVDMEDSVVNQKIEIQSLSLLTEGVVPDDCECLFILSPQSDITDSERDIIAEYLAGGGNMFLITDYVDENGLPNIESLMSSYGVELNDGIVIEGSQDYCLYGYVHYLMPSLSSHEITSPLLTGGYNVVLPISQGLTISDELRDGLTVTSLFETSDDAYSKVAGYNMTTYDKEDGDIDGPFSLGVAITDASDSAETNIVWIPSSMFLDADPNSYSSGANEDLFLNALSWMCEVEGGISIHAKSLDAEHLTTPGSAKSVLSFAVTIFIPLVMLGGGVATAIVRRRK